MDEREKNKCIRIYTFNYVQVRSSTFNLVSIGTLLRSALR